MIRKLFFISLLANLGLVAAVAYRVAHRPAAVAETALEKQSVAEASTLAVKSRATTVSYVTNETRAEFSWALIETSDYKKYIANLRAIGCPEETIRDIIIADVSKNYARRGMALQREQRAKQKYWQYARGNQAANPAAPWRQIRAWEKEKQALLKELLGPDILDEMEKTQAGGLFGLGGKSRKEWAFLPADKRDLAREVNEKYQELVQEVYIKANNDQAEDLGAQVRAVQKQKLVELALILSPQELEDYELRLSQTARNLRWQVQFFNASEDEFRKIFKLQKGFDEQYAGDQPDPDDRESMKKWKEADTVLHEAQKAALGETRYTAFTRGQDYEYQRLTQLAAREGLSVDVADKVYDIRQAVEKERDRLNSDKSLTREERRAGLQEIKSTVEKSVTQILGEKNYVKYRNNGASWLNEME